jgi:hypothetical protein
MVVKTNFHIVRSGNNFERGWLINVSFFISYYICLINLALLMTLFKSTNGLGYFYYKMVLGC